MGNSGSSGVKEKHINVSEKSKLKEEDKKKVNTIIEDLKKNQAMIDKIESGDYEHKDQKPNTPHN